jgi:hypothetical protein
MDRSDFYLYLKCACGGSLEVQAVFGLHYNAQKEAENWRGLHSQCVGGSDETPSDETPSDETPEEDVPA